MTRKYQAHLELFQCKEVDTFAQTERNRQQAAINAARRHFESGSKAKPFVVPGYEAVYLQEYDRLSQVAARVG